MASGHYETYMTYVVVNGKKKAVQRKRWVADKPTTSTQNKANDAVEAAALREAKRKAALLAAKQRKEAERRRMWRELQLRAKDLRETIAPPKNTPGRPPPVGGDRDERRVVDAQAEIARSKQRQAEQARWTAMAEFYKKQAAAAKRKADIERASKEIGSKWAGKTLERLLAEARERQKVSGGQDLNVDEVKQLSELYDKHAERVATTFKKKVARLNDLLVKKKGKYYYRDEAAAARASRILASPEYKQALAEYDRLFGDGTKQNTGQYTVAQTAYGQIAESQRTYIREAAKEAFFKGYDQLRRGDREDRAEAQKMLEDWEKGEKWLYEASIADIDPTKTSWKYQWDPNEKRSVPVRRTVEEEFQYRQQQYIAEMKRQYEKYKQERLLEQKRQAGLRMRAKREANRPGAFQREYDVNLIAKTSRAMGLDPKKGPTTREEMNALVDEAMKTWTAENGKWFASKNAPMDTYTAMAWQGRDPRTIKDQAAFKKAYDAQRARLYSVFSTEAPGILETVTGLPVIKPALQVLGGVGSLPMVLARMEAAAGGNLFFGGGKTDGNNTSKLLGADPSMEQLPASVKRQLDAEVARQMEGVNPQTGGQQLWAAARVGAYQKWLKTPEGKKWYEETLKANKQASSDQDKSFYEGVYNSGGDIWKVLDALSAYGGSATNNDLLNLGLSLATDPTNAVPLKATTWLARIDHALNATQGVSGLMGLNRATQASLRFLKVTEPELRLEKTLKPYLEKLGKGADPAAVREEILTKLAGIKDGPSRAKETEKLFRQYGIDPRSASGHQLMSLVEESLVKKFEDFGIDYRDVARQAAELEGERLAKEAAEKAARSENIRKFDATREAAEKTARESHEAASAELKAQRAATEQAVEARTRRPVVERAAPDRPLERTTGHPEPEIQRMVSADPLRRAAGDVGGEGTASARRVQAAKAAETVQAITGSQDVVTRHGVQWASPQAADAFAQSESGRRLLADLDATLPNGRPNTAVRQLAEDRIYEYGRRSIAQKIGREESILSRSGEKIALKEGRIPWETRVDGNSFMVKGGRRSHEQYIPSSSDLALRGGAKNPTEELVIAQERKVFEELKQRALYLRSRLETGKITQEMFDEEVKEIRRMGVARRSTDLTKDIRMGSGNTIQGELDRILNGDMADFIPTGDILIEDLMSIGHLDMYYETFSMIPGMMKGYDTSLMRNILDPSWRASLTRGMFTKILRKTMYLTDVGPVEFRAGGAHLFALFHLTLLDGDLKLLRSYSKSVETLLNNDPMNIFGRMWKVMETRAGLDWADDFLIAEGAFMEAAIFGKRLHPNLALAMIPYGPMARNLPITHGFVGHLRGLATTLNPLVKVSPARWVDETVTSALEKIAKRAVTTEEAIGISTQIIHYVQSRYGNALRRASFTKVARDFSIEASYRASRNTFGFQELRSRYIKMREEGLAVRLPGEDEFIADTEIRIEQLNNAAAAASFDNMFNPARLRGTGKKRLQFDPIHALYDEMYWAGEVTHDVPGLHTTQFLLKMGDPKLARGDSWVKYANAYWDHMVGAGAEAEARTLLKIMFEPEIARVAGNAYEQMLDAGGTTWKPRTYGAVADFMERAGLLDLDRALAEGRRRVRQEKSYAETEVANAQMRNEFLLADEDVRSLADAFDDPNEITSLYDNADIGNVVIEAQRQIESLTRAADTMDELAEGRTALQEAERALARLDSELERVNQITRPQADARLFDKEGAIERISGERKALLEKIDALKKDPAAANKQTRLLVRRPADSVMDAAHKRFNFLKKKAGDEAALDFLRSRPDPVRKWLSVELRQKSAQTELTRLLNSVMRQMIHMEAIPGQVGLDIEELLRYVRTMPDGPEFLGAWAKKYSQDLYASRLIDYFRHEKWFIDLEKREAAEAAARTAERNAADLQASVDRAVAAVDEAAAATDEAAAATDEAAAATDEAAAAPSPADLNHGRIRMSQRVLEMLKAMPEEEWLQRELMKAQRMRRAHAKGSPEYESAAEQIRNVLKAMKVIEVAKSGGKGSFVPPRARTTFASTIVSVAGERAKAVIAPKMIAPYVVNGAGAIVEQGRMLNRLLRNSPVDPSLGKARAPGEVSETYAKHGAAIEEAFDKPISVDFLRRHGFPDDLLSEITGTQLITNLDEFADSLRNPRFTELVNELSVRMSMRLRTITGDATYSVERWLDDRLVQRGEFYDARKFEKDDLIVAEAIRRARNGARRTTRTDLRKRPGRRGENPLTELIETDIRAVIGKAEALSKLGVDPHAYNEARKVLRTPMLKKRYAHQIVAAATKKAVDDLYAAGKKVDDADWDTLFREAYDKAFLEKRAAMADEEAIKLLDLLAYDEMFGSSAEDIIREFEKRYGTDMNVKGYEPGPITPYQKRTLEEAVKTHLGVTDVYDPAQMVEALSRHGQHPPFNNRSQMREWLAKYGFWSPRTAEAIEAGKKSWSIHDEAQYYKDNWGFAPDWANPDLIAEGGPLRDILFDERLYGEQNRKWGLFNRNMEARFATGKMTREERARLMVEGSESLGIKAKRDLPTERKYVIERYGRLVTDEAGNLTAFPWLMNREELRAFFINRTAKGAIPDNLLQTAEELAVVEELIAKYMGKYFDETVMAGKPATYADLHAIAANIVTDLMDNPVWLKRNRDAVGSFIRGQAELRRALVFTQLPFMMTNVIDSGIKGAWTSFITRSFRNGEVSAKAGAFRLEDFGLNPLMTQLFTEPVQRGTKRIAKAREEGNALRFVQGISELPAEGSAAAENIVKLRLAQGMYDGVYAEALKKLKDPALADAAAREFIGKEVSRLWPTVGDGPIEKLFNNLSPFMSYQFKNRVLFISEMASHPAMYNWLNRIGDYIEKQNRDRWEREGTVPDPKNARLIELPWAPGHFIDLGTFSDAQRGLKPLYDAADGKVVVGNFISQFVRLAGPNDINFALGILNALKLPMRTEYIQRMDEDGYPTGVWDSVEVPWEAPWGGEANVWNSLWPVELGSAFSQALEGKFSVEELTKLAYRTLFFGQLKQTDKGAALNAVYYALKEKDEKAAEAWLATADGKALQMWWLDKAAESKEWYSPQDLRDILNPPTADPNPWFHAKSDEFQEKVKGALDDLNMIRRKWDNVIFGLTPGTDDYRQARLMAANERYQFFQDHPELYEFFAFSMTPAEWAEQLDEWVVDDLVDTYYNMKAPTKKDGETEAAFQKRRREWLQQREAFLKMYPKVAERIGQARNSVEQVWHDTEQGWFDVLDRVGTKSIALEAARQSKDFDLLDQLYIAQDLEFKTLNEDVAVHYFNTVTDFAPLARDMQGPPAPRKDPFGNALLPLTKVLPDFNKWRYDRMTVDQKAEFERDQKYGTGMKDVIAKAKASDNFGATFVRELKKDPWLLNEYFRRNPGKREKWAETDEYIRLISRYGILAKQGKFTEAGRYFDNLPNWVKARYYEKHPERRQKMQENMQYMNWMERWTNFYRRRDYSGGAAFFDKMPKWVKDRYYSKHPDGFGRGGGTSAYAKAMGKWVKLLQDGKKDEAKAYFDSLPAAYKNRYYEGHPEAKIRNNIKRVGQLGEYFAADDANRALYLKNNPDFAKWLRAQGSKESTRRMLIMAAYQGLPKDDQWLRRVFREKYPEIFSQEAKGEASLKKTYNFLSEHPDMLPAFEKWLEAVWASYAENMKHTAAPPKPIVSDHSRQRQHGITRYAGRHTGKSAEWVRLHSIS